MLTSKDHDHDARQQQRAGREWVDIGSGGWDRSGRPSEVRVNRIIRVDPDAIRREGAVLARERFEEVATAIRQVALAPPGAEAVETGQREGPSPRER